MFESPRAAVWRYSHARQTTYGFRTVGFDQTTPESYIEYFDRLDPGRPVLNGAPVGTWKADEELLDLRAREQQEYVRDFALPFGIGRVAAARILATPASYAYFSVQREPGIKPFGERSRRVYALIGRHLERVAKMEDRVTALEAREAICEAAIDALTAGLCVVDAQSAILLANRAARESLTGGAALVLRGGRLTSPSPAVQEKLARAVQAACLDKPQGSAFNVGLKALGRQTMQVIVLPVHEAHELGRISNSRVALVFVAHPQSPHLSAQTLRSLFGVTAAEASLLAALVAGSTVSDYAQSRSISISTVRTHLAALLEKTGVDCQAKLVGLAKALPSLRD